jgi:hypothetical protein
MLGDECHAAESDRVDRDQGCCAQGYAASAEVPFAATTGAEPAHFPYLMAALCERSA